MERVRDGIRQRIEALSENREPDLAEIIECRIVERRIARTVVIRSRTGQNYHPWRARVKGRDRRSSDKFSAPPC